jgi:hypothetical protein
MIWLITVGECYVAKVAKSMRAEELAYIDFFTLILQHRVFHQKGALASRLPLLPVSIGDFVEMF